jgi:hypothetical protein
VGGPVRHLPRHPGELDLSLPVAAAHHARTTGRGIWADPHTLLAYECRAVEKLYRFHQEKAAGQGLARGEAYSWRERYCAEMRTCVLHGPEDYTAGIRSIGCSSGRETCATRSAVSTSHHRHASPHRRGKPGLASPIGMAGIDVFLGGRR